MSPLTLSIHPNSPFVSHKRGEGQNPFRILIKWNIDTSSWQYRNLTDTKRLLSRTPEQPKTLLNYFFLSRFSPLDFFFLAFLLLFCLLSCCFIVVGVIICTISKLKLRHFFFAFAESPRPSRYHTANEERKTKTRRREKKSSTTTK